MERALINQKAITWARQRAGLKIPDLAKKLNVKPERALSWEKGELRPTIKQAQKIARVTYIPFGYLYLAETPKEKLPIPDLRSPGDPVLDQVSLELRDTIMAVKFRQSWYREYQINLGEPQVEIVGSFKIEDCTERIVNDMKDKLNIENCPDQNKREPYFRYLVDQIERVGILVMQNSVVGSNTHRKLNVREFRGFAIVDEYAPAVFINKADAPGAQLFTLLHEAAHIWLNKSGISDGERLSQNKVERKCNEIAAEFLVPKDQFLEHWRKNLENWERNLQPLARRYHVSRWVIARRASEFNLISADQYWSFVNKLMDQKKRQSGGGGPSPHIMRTQRVSRRVARAVVSEALCGNLLLRDAWRLIEIKPHKLCSYAESLQLRES